MNDDHQDVYRARIWSNNSILITFPAWDYSLLHNRDTYAARLKGVKAPAGIIDAVDDALHTYNVNLKGNHESGRDVQRVGKNKHVLVESNDNITLSAKVICNHDEQEDETKLPAYTFDEEYVCAKGNVNRQSVVVFLVAIDGKPMKKGKIDATRIGSLQMQMGNCTVSSPPIATGRHNQDHPSANSNTRQTYDVPMSVGSGPQPNPTYNVPMSVGGSASRPPAKRYRQPAAGGAGPFPSAYQQLVAGTY